MCMRRKMRELVDSDRLGDCPLPNKGTTMPSRRTTCIPCIQVPSRRSDIFLGMDMVKFQALV